MFVDYAVINVYAGTGGSGAEAWRREMGVARGGPHGGDGGRGGDIILRADSQLATLLDYSYQQHYKAERGEHGQGKGRTGRDGKDLLLRVPVGTVIRDADTSDILGELVDEGQELIVAKGGRGGRGNEAFATPTNRAPTKWEPGADGEERKIALEHKLMADVGLDGKPNAGKTTSLAAVWADSPKSAASRLTTHPTN